MYGVLPSAASSGQLGFVGCCRSVLSTSSAAIVSPASRSAWSAGSSSALELCEIDVSWVHEDEVEAARAADGMAERAAERNREYLESLENLMEDAA